MHFNIQLGRTYWTKGFFNVPVDFERFFVGADGRFDIYLGNSTEPLVGRSSRSANGNATPRIYGNRALAEFFQEWYRVGDTVRVEVISESSVRIPQKEANR